MRVLTGLWIGWWMVAGGMAHANVTDRQIANMFILGFEGKTLTARSPIVRAVCDRGLGGVILFTKNIASPSQLRTLTGQLTRCGRTPLIAVDQEGGTVRRIRFGQDYPRAAQVAGLGPRAARKIYTDMARELQSLGINYNLAPVADLDIEPRNFIIHKLGRSYGADPKIVMQYNNIFIDAMHRDHIVTALKHFPGHGSSLGDTHRGFVDVTRQWRPAELQPFGNRRADSVMVAHVVNGRITEPGRPASLSPKAIKKLRTLNPHAVIITDDLQMGAIRKHYSLTETIRLAIKAGDDLLLFGNQLSRKDTVHTDQLIAIVRGLIARDPGIARAIRAANRRIGAMRKKIHLRSVRSRPSRPRRSAKKHPAVHRKTFRSSGNQPSMY